MIVRISTEGQYEMLENDVEALDELDHQAIDACQANDEEHFNDVFGRLIEFVRTNGQPVPDDRLEASDLILPPPDSTLAEARAEFSAEGLIPE
jgi:hypothetical protein